MAPKFTPLPVYVPYNPQRSVDVLGQGRALLRSARARVITDLDGKFYTDQANLAALQQKATQPLEDQFAESSQFLAAAQGRVRQGLIQKLAYDMASAEELGIQPRLGPRIPVGGIVLGGPTVAGSLPSPTPTCDHAYLILRWPASEPVFPCPQLYSPYPDYLQCPAPDMIYAVCYMGARPVGEVKTAGGFTYTRWRVITMTQYQQYLNVYGHSTGPEIVPLMEAMGVELGNL